MRARIVLATLCLLASPLQAQSYRVVPPAREGITPFQAGAVRDSFVECAAPFGGDTVFALDSSQKLWAVQRRLRRIAGLEDSDIAQFAADRERAFASTAAMRNTLLRTSNVHPRMKQALTDLPPPRPGSEVQRLQVPTSPVGGAAPDDRFASLNRALSRARATIWREGLATTFLAAVVTCSYDLSELPTQVTDRRSRRMIVLPAEPTAREGAAPDWPAFTRVSLYELMDNFGHEVELGQAAPQ